MVVMNGQRVKIFERQRQKTLIQDKEKSKDKLVNVKWTWFHLTESEKHLFQSWRLVKVKKCLNRIRYLMKG